jgi:hypothetical protein
VRLFRKPRDFQDFAKPFETCTAGNTATNVKVKQVSSGAMCFASLYGRVYGASTLLMAGAFPKSRFFGFD